MSLLQFHFLTYMDYTISMVRCSAPTRIDLAGGSLDLWPLSMMVPEASTLNMAISLMATVEVKLSSGDYHFIESSDMGLCYKYPVEASGKLPLIETLLDLYSGGKHLHVKCKSDVPPGSGLGGSSTMGIALSMALFNINKINPPLCAVAETCKDAEAKILGIPTGIQDFYPALMGGILFLQYSPKGTTVNRIKTDFKAFESRLVLCYTGKSRSSATANWDLVKRAVDGNMGVLEALRNIAGITARMKKDIETGSWLSAGEGLNAEMIWREKLSSEIVTPEIKAVFEISRANGAFGAKVCGAGGGGTVVILADTKVVNCIKNALDREGFKVLNFTLKESGFCID